MKGLILIMLLGGSWVFLAVFFIMIGNIIGGLL
jgi:hypothetical protein